MKLIADKLRSEQFQSLRLACGLEPLESGLIEKALKRSLLTLCAEEDGKLVGMLRLVGDGALAVVLCDVLVVPECRRRGIGAALIDSALEWVAEDMPSGKWVSVMLTCANEKTAYYSKFGFRPFDGGVQGTAMQAFVKGIDTAEQKV